MRKKEIIIVIVALIVIGVAAFFLIGMLFPQQKGQEAIRKEPEKVPQIRTEIDTRTFEAVERLSDYGVPELTNIGKSNIFQLN